MLLARAAHSTEASKITPHRGHDAAFEEATNSASSPLSLLVIEMPEIET